jgi:hypothetical protein
MSTDEATPFDPAPTEHNCDFTIDAFGLDGNRRAFSHARSYDDAMLFLDLTPNCLVPREKLIIHIEGFLYLGPPDQVDDWSRSEEAQKVRALIERRQKGVRHNQPG